MSLRGFKTQSFGPEVIDQPNNCDAVNYSTNSTVKTGQTQNISYFVIVEEMVNNVI